MATTVRCTGKSGKCNFFFGRLECIAVNKNEVILEVQTRCPYCKKREFQFVSVARKT